MQYPCILSEGFNRMTHHDKLLIIAFNATESWQIHIVYYGNDCFQCRENVNLPEENEKFRTKNIMEHVMPG